MATQFTRRTMCRLIPVFAVATVTLRADAQASPASPPASSEQVARLRAERAGLLEQLAQSTAAAEQRDPLMRRAADLMNTGDYDPGAARTAQNWLAEQSKDDPSINSKFQSLIGLAQLSAVLEIAADAADVAIARAGIVEPSKLDRSVMADFVARAIPTIDRKGLDDPQALWGAVEANRVALAEALRKEREQVAQATGWPERHISALWQEWHELGRRTIGGLYRRANTPRAKEVDQELLRIAQELRSSARASGEQRHTVGNDGFPSH